MELHSLGNEALHFLEIPSVLKGADDVSDSLSFGCEGFLLQSADFEDFSIQGNLPSHCIIGIIGFINSNGGQSGGDRDSSRRAVLFGSSLWKVDMERFAFEELIFGEFFSQKFLDETQGYLDALLHNVSQLACDYQLLFRVLFGKFDNFKLKNASSYLIIAKAQRESS